MNSPLQGWRVLIGSSSNTTNAELIRLLDEVGATAQVVPLLQIVPPEDGGELDAAVLALSAGDYQWVAFTSANTVRAVFGRAGELEVTPVISAQTRVAAVGPATVTALRSAGSPVDLVPDHRQSAAGLAEIWPSPTSVLPSVLLPGSQIALDTLAYALTAIGYEVDRVVAYRTENVRPASSVIDDVLSGQYRAVLLHSPSAAASLAAAVTVPSGVVIGSIGHTTAQAATEHGLTVTFIASSPTPAALVDGLVELASSRPAL